MTEVQHYFAASNSFDGFISYFDIIFNREKFKHIFILKGGPGTGKSSFMKKIAQQMIDRGIDVEMIHCSSDPDSLDGIIITYRKEKIAIIDGTSPHTFDPKYPGASETIINLGDSLNIILLKNNFDRIKELTAKKQYHYKTAYEYLSIAKRCSDIVEEEIKATVTDDVLSAIDFIFENTTKQTSEISSQLLSSFGARGFLNFESKITEIEKTVNVVGIYGSQYLFTNEILKEAKRKKQNLIISPSPIKKSNYDAIYIESNKTAITTDSKFYKKADVILDTSKYMNQQLLSEKRCKLETLYKETELMLWCASDEFKKASEMHFALEKIYTAAMDFKKNKKLMSKTLLLINELLSITEETTET